MLKRIQLENFRNIKSLKLNIGEKTLFYGNNAQGKTNILEGIYFLSILKSFRGKDVNLIMKNEAFCSVVGEKESELRGVIQKDGELLRKTFLKNNIKISGKKMINEFLAVLFSPEDIELISSSPSERRRYLDIVLCKTDSAYLETLSKYRKIVKQRNALLKNIKKGYAKESGLDIWDEGLIESGIFIIKKRERLIEDFNKKINDFYKKVSGGNEKVSLKYITDSKDEEELKGNIGKSKNTDIAAGITLKGPHRDDVEFLKDGDGVGGIASRGEFRTLILALKLCEGEYLKSITGKEVTYLLDDVFSELDKDRREALLRLVQKEQVVFTTTDLDHVTKEFIESSDTFKVENGKIKTEIKN